MQIDTTRPGGAALRTNTSNNTGDYFALFALPVGFGIDLNDLAQRYRDLQRALHPDRHASASASERLLSVSRSADLNAAYQTLRDPVQRARYLLVQSGAHWQDEQTISDRDFLLTQMDLREQLEELYAAKDGAGIEQLAQHIQQLEQAQEAQLAHSFAELDALRLEQGRSDIQKLMFFRKLKSETEERLALLEEA